MSKRSNPLKFSPVTKKTTAQQTRIQKAKIQLSASFLDSPVTFKMGQGHQNWYGTDKS